MSAGTAPPHEAAADRPTLYTPAFIGLCLTILLGFCSFGIIGPVIPVIVLEAGGDAALAGIVVAVFSIPSVLLRPFFGRLVDEWSKRRVLILGTIGLGLSSILYVIPGILSMVVVRLLHGSAWGAFNTGGNSTLADIAPRERRGEASGVYGLMPGLSQMAMPSLGLALLAAGGAAAPFLVAACLAFGATALAVAGPRTAPVVRRAGSGPGFRGSLIERRVLLPMTLEFLWMSTNCIFFVFPPVWAKAQGIPIEELALYYPALGVSMVAARLLIGPRLDRVARGRPVILGAVLGAIGLGVAASAHTVLVLAVGGSLYAVASALTSPIHLALAMDRALPERLGAAMATYSLGYQLGLGIGSATYGLVISLAGFPLPFVIGMGAMLAMIAAVLHDRTTLLSARAVSAG